MQFVRHLEDRPADVQRGLMCEVTPDRWVYQTTGGSGGVLIELWDVRSGFVDEVLVPFPDGEPGFSAPLVGGSIIPGEVVVIWGRFYGALSMSGDSLQWDGWAGSIGGGGNDPYFMNFQREVPGPAFFHCSGYPLLTGVRDGVLWVFGGDAGLFRCVLGPGATLVSGWETLWENYSEDWDWRYFRMLHDRSQTLPNGGGGFDFVCRSSFENDEGILVSVDAAGTVALSPPSTNTTNPSEAVRNPDGSVSVIWGSFPPTLTTYTLDSISESPLPVVAGGQHTSSVFAGASSTSPGVPVTGYMGPSSGGPPTFGLQERDGAYSPGWRGDVATSPAEFGISLSGGWFVHQAPAPISGIYWRVWKWRPGGWWHLRQRQTLTGADGWPLRHLQAGANHGSHPLRQRQQGV